MESPLQPWPGHHPVAYLPGSLPMGGVVPMTPVHAFDSVPTALQLQEQPALQPRRSDIDLGGLLAFVIDRVVTPAEADAMVQADAWNERLEDAVLAPLAAELAERKNADARKAAATKVDFFTMVRTRAEK